MTVNCMTATQLSNAKIVGEDGRTVARIAEIMLDTTGGKIVYVALAIGGVFGCGERLFAVPWAAFHYDDAAAVFRIDATVADFTCVAGFDKDAWPRAADQRLAGLAP